MLLEVQPVRLKVCDFGLARTIPGGDALRHEDDADAPGAGAPATPKSDAGDSPASLKSTGSARPPLRRQLTQHVVTRWYRAPELLLRSPTYPPGPEEGGLQLEC